MSTNEKKTLVIHNVKNRNYRQMHVDGAHGGITPSGLINLSFYSQRGAIPKGSEFEITDDKQIGRLVKNIEGSKEGIIREFEFGIYMDVNTCVNLKNFLENKIKEYRELTQTKD